jgi:hypothetical protein
MGVGSYSRLNKKIHTKGVARQKGMRGTELKEAPVSGAGLFAKERIKKGEIIWVDMPDENGMWNIVEGTMDQLVELYSDLWDQYEDYIYHERDNIYRGAMINQEDNDYSVYLNHSCDPNVWYAWRDDLGFEVMEALRDITAGEEITIDYALMEGGGDWVGGRVGLKSFDCCCNSPACRGAVYVDDWMKLELQERYKGHFHYYLEAQIAQLHQSRREERHHVNNW